MGKTKGKKRSVDERWVKPILLFQNRGLRNDKNEINSKNMKKII